MIRRTAVDPMDRAIVPHIRRAHAAITSRLADAHAQASMGNLPMASNRLNGLLDSLITPDGRGIIGDARAAAYRDAHTSFDPELHDPERRHPTPEGMRAARTAPIGGVDARREAAGLIGVAQMGLATAYHAADDPDGRRAALGGWHARHRDVLRAWARRTLSDSQVAITTASQWLRLRPEFRED